MKHKVVDATPGAGHTWYLKLDCGHYVYRKQRGLPGSSWVAPPPAEVEDCPVCHSEAVAAARELLRRIRGEGGPE